MSKDGTSKEDFHTHLQHNQAAQTFVANFRKKNKLEKPNVEQEDHSLGDFAP